MDYCTHETNTLDMSFTSAYSVTNHDLEYHEIHARLVPKWLTAQLKWTRVETSTQQGSSHYWNDSEKKHYVLPQSPWSPHLAPSHHHILGRLNMRYVHADLQKIKRSRTLCTRCFTRIPKHSLQMITKISVRINKRVETQGRPWFENDSVFVLVCLV